jgi:hypothetical protein
MTAVPSATNLWGKIVFEGPSNNPGSIGVYQDGK